MAWTSVVVQLQALGPHAACSRFFWLSSFLSNDLMLYVCKSSNLQKHEYDEACSESQAINSRTTNLQEKNFNDISNRHNETVAGCQEALMVLQAKVTHLEQQCNDHHNINKDLKEQLSTLMKLSNTGSNFPNSHREHGDNENSNNNIQVAESENATEQLFGIFTGLENNNKTETLQAKHGGGGGGGGGGRLLSQSLTPPDSLKNASLSLSQISTGVPPESFSTSSIEEDVSQAMDFKERSSLQDNILSEHTVPASRLYSAKYSYDPFEGPNKHPEAELPLVAGDSVYVYGVIDDDGFYEGELMDGRRGLVPSNFLELVDNERGSRQAWCDITNASDHNVDNWEHYKSGSFLGKEGALFPNDSRLQYSDPSMDGVMRNHSLSFEQQTTQLHSSASCLSIGILPYPRKLRVEKKLSHSLIIGWVAPQLDEDDFVEEYHILVDGNVVNILKGSKSKAVVENIYHHQKNYLISVCAVTERGRSEPSHCILSCGLNGPQDIDVRLQQLTMRSARIVWDPINSNSAHSISIEEILDESNHAGKYHQRRIAVVPPFYEHTIDGLKPDIMYQVVVKSKDPVAKLEIASNQLRFLTPLIGPPVAPLGVQVDERTALSDFLVVTWLPVALDERGTSNGVVVTGYAVYINGQKCTLVESSTSESCRVSLQALADTCCKLLEEDHSYRRHINNFFRHGRHASHSIFAEAFSSLRMTVRTVGENNLISDDSAPHYLHKKVIGQVLRILRDSKQEISVEHKTRNIRYADADVKEALSPISSAYKSSNSVPAIEITSDTSGEDELQRIFQSGGRAKSSALSPVRQSKNTEKKSKTSPSSSKQKNKKTGVHIESAECEVTTNNISEDGPAGNIRSDSASVFSSLEGLIDFSLPSNHLPYMQRYFGNCRIQSDDESVSVSSGGHTSTSTTGSLYQTHRPSPKVSTERNWASARFRNAGKIPLSRDQVVMARDKRSISSTSVYSDEQVAVLKDETNQNSNLNKSMTRARNNQSDLQFEPALFNRMRSDHVSLFVALYDYNPYMMSPNASSLKDELAFTEGQLLKVYGNKDRDGFYQGVDRQGRYGFIPCNMVSSVQVDDDAMLEELFEIGHLPSESSHESRMNTDTSGMFSDQTLPVFAELSTPLSLENKHPASPILCVALYDYDPKEASPNIDSHSELSFSQGDFIKIYGPMDDDGFFKGELNGRIGLVPSNYLEHITQEQAEAFKRLKESELIGNTPTKVSATTMTETPTMRNAKRNSFKPSKSGNGDAKNIPSGSSNVTQVRSDANKKKGIFSKGKKFFKKLGGNELRNRR